MPADSTPAAATDMNPYAAPQSQASRRATVLASEVLDGWRVIDRDLADGIAARGTTTEDEARRVIQLQDIVEGNAAWSGGTGPYWLWLVPIALAAVLVWFNPKTWYLLLMLALFMAIMLPVVFQLRREQRSRARARLHLLSHASVAACVYRPGIRFDRHDSSTVALWSQFSHAIVDGDLLVLEWLGEPTTCLTRRMLPQPAQWQELVRRVSSNLRTGVRRGEAIAGEVPQQPAVAALPDWEAFRHASSNWLVHQAEITPADTTEPHWSAAYGVPRWLPELGRSSGVQLLGVSVAAVAVAMLIGDWFGMLAMILTLVAVPLLAAGAIQTAIDVARLARTGSVGERRSFASVVLVGEQGLRWLTTRGDVCCPWSAIDRARMAPGTIVLEGSPLGQPLYLVARGVSSPNDWQQVQQLVRGRVDAVRTL